MNKSEERALNILKRAYDNKGLHHAILLYGQSLSSLEFIAKELSNLLLDTQNCDKHPDFFKLRPEGKMRQIKIGSDSDRVGGEFPPNTMRWLLNKLSKSANGNGAKVALVVEADRMNIYTGNAFLKTLEEPPAGTTLIMLSQRPNDLLDTIKSRCISIRIESMPNEIDNEEWQEWLQDFENWIAKSTKIGSSKEKTNAYLIEAYALLARYEKVINEILEENLSLSDETTANMEKEEIEALEASERKSIRKDMLVQMENSILNSASSGEIAISKISQIVESLETSVGLMELNMKDTIALENFILTSIRILFAKN
ncbi:MAG: hypothetical protein R3Y46_04785 [Opitutales bacterium]